MEEEGMEKLKVHEYATRFPLMEGEEFDALVEDIRQHGLLEPIVVLDGDTIIDGRNRYRACQKAGVEPRFETYKGNGVLTYVISKNILRRHLNSTQRALLGVELEKDFAVEAAQRQAAQRAAGVPAKGAGQKARLPKERGDRENLAAAHAAKVVQVTPEAVRRAKRVVREAPDLVPRMAAGKLPLEKAVQEVRLRKGMDQVKSERARSQAKKRQDDPREVKKFLVAVKVYDSATADFDEECENAVGIVKFGKFSPEAKRFTLRKLEAVEAGMAATAKRIRALKEALVK